MAVAHLAVTFVGLQAVDLLIPATTRPSWADAFLPASLIVGFPVAVAVARAFEVTPGGMRRTPGTQKEGTPEAPEEQRGTRRAVQLLAALGLIAMAGAGIWLDTCRLGAGGCVEKPGTEGR